MTSDALDLLVEDYFDDRLSAEQIVLFERALLENPAVMNRLIVSASLHQLLQDRFSADANDGLHTLVDVVGDPDTSADDRAVMDLVVSNALAERRKHELSAEANRQLAVQQQEDALNRRFEMRRNAEPEPTKRVLVVPQAAAWIGIAALVGLIMWVAWPTTAPVNEESSSRTAQTQTPRRSTEAVEERAVVVARVSDSVDARWQGGAEPGPLTTGTTLSLESGFAEIAFDDRGVVLVEGPATVEVVETGTLRLVEGRVVARSTHAADPLTMLVDNTALRGLQAEFGVSCDSRTSATALVYAGSIGVTATSLGAQASAVQLGMGQVAALSTQHGTIGSQSDFTSLQSASYSRSIDGARGRPAGHTETVRYLADAPSDLFLGELVSSEHVWLFREVQGVRINDTVARAFSDIQPTLGVFYSGQVMDSYLLHMDPVGDDEGSPTAIEGSLTFDRPIHVVLGDARTLRATDIVLGLPGLAYPRTAPTAGGVPGARAWGIEQGDVLTLSRDRRTLHFRIQASSSLDQVRILVACEGSN